MIQDPYLLSTSMTPSLESGVKNHQYLTQSTQHLPHLRASFLLTRPLSVITSQPPPSQRPASTQSAPPKPSAPCATECCEAIQGISRPSEIAQFASKAFLTLAPGCSNN